MKKLNHKQDLAGGRTLGQFVWALCARCPRLGATAPFVRGVWHHVRLGPSHTHTFISCPPSPAKPSHVSPSTRIFAARAVVGTHLLGPAYQQATLFRPAVACHPGVECPSLFLSLLRARGRPSRIDGATAGDGAPRGYPHSPSVPRCASPARHPGCRPHGHLLAGGCRHALRSSADELCRRRRAHCLDRRRQRRWRVDCGTPCDTDDGDDSAVGDGSEVTGFSAHGRYTRGREQWSRQRRWRKQRPRQPAQQQRGCRRRRRR